MILERHEQNSTDTVHLSLSLSLSSIVHVACTPSGTGHSDCSSRASTELDSTRITVVRALRAPVSKSHSTVLLARGDPRRCFTNFTYRELRRTLPRGVAVGSAVLREDATGLSSWRVFMSAVFSFILRTKRGQGLRTGS